VNAEVLAMRTPPSPRRYRLLDGPYAAPACRVGRKLYCKWRRRWIAVDGLTDAPVVWPFSKRAGPRSLILCGDLVRAVRCESASAVAAHWGVGRETVWRWRRVLGVGQFNRGTLQLNRDTVPERVDLARLAEARAASRTPEARARMSATRKGRRPPAAFLAAGREAARRPKSESFKAQLSERLRREWASGARRPHPPGRPWRAEEIARLGRAPDAVVARELGRTPAAVQKARLRLGIPCPPEA
jgi:hypothetical protein